MVEIIEIIHRYVRPGGLIWDVTCGTMTTGLAAMRLGRPCIMTDRDGDLVKAAELRLEFLVLLFLLVFLSLSLYVFDFIIIIMFFVVVARNDAIQCAMTWP